MTNQPSSVLANVKITFDEDTKTNSAAQSIAETEQPQTSSRTFVKIVKEANTLISKTRSTSLSLAAWLCLAIVGSTILFMAFGVEHIQSNGEAYIFIPQVVTYAKIAYLLTVLPAIAAFTGYIYMLFEKNNTNYDDNGRIAIGGRVLRIGMFVFTFFVLTPLTILGTLYLTALLGSKLSEKQLAVAINLLIASIIFILPIILVPVKNEMKLRKAEDPTDKQLVKKTLFTSLCLITVVIFLCGTIFILTNLTNGTFTGYHFGSITH
ncbi:hypothetical protein NEFER03_1551 [Nematocida sp. LUAm3]|nr:hypothetical protein NEFER03_1551 [Nematocida sp. LUAm3]KAI5174584.1 hypothetical protein NEFER02_0705 [Nematocida sp. LUAm2]KAI5178010.1 hypothetical protein NEFER01_1192 [Nematocida sp. LUAm1]